MPSRLVAGTPPEEAYKMKKAAVCGGSGFLGTWMCERLRKEGYYVTSFDLKMPEFGSAPANEYFIFDLRNPVDYYAEYRWGDYDLVVQMAANMGGAEFVFSGNFDAEIMQHSARINLNVLEACRQFEVPNVLFTSSACVYPTLAGAEACKESDTPNPDSSYGIEKLFSERLYDAYARNYGMNIKVARVHNAFGAYGTWRGGREKSPAAFMRKIAEIPRNGSRISCFGDGEQRRSFIHASEAVEAFWRLIKSDVVGQPINVGSSEMVSIKQMIAMIARIADKTFDIEYVPGPLGVQARSSNNDLIEQHLGWKPSMSLQNGLEMTFPWIRAQVDKQHAIK